MKPSTILIALLSSYSLMASAKSAEPLPVVPQLNLATAQQLAQAAQKAASENQAPASIVIADAAGIPLVLIRMDNAAGASAALASGKAKTAALFKKPTQDLEQAINTKRPAAITGEYVMMGGGIPVNYRGHVIGAVGVSSPNPQLDIKIAEAALSALTE